jgi:hypothetical protein
LVYRKTLILKHGSLWEEVFEERTRFWTYDSFGTSIGDKFQKLMDLTFSIIKVLAVSATGSVLLHCATPYFDTTLLLPQACWIPGNYFFMRVILYVLECVFYSETVFLIAAFDGFYLLMCINLKIQFGLLYAAVRSIKLGENATKDHEESCWKILKEYSQYHTLLLK